MSEKKFIIPHQHTNSRNDREILNGHRGKVLWFTGLSGSGKSTIADKVDQILYSKGIHGYILDGDNVRAGLNKNLGFSEADRKENLRRIGEVSKLFVDAGLVVLSAFVSPTIADRSMVKSIIGEQDFIEIFIDTSLEECEKRDVKGLYKKARLGEIKNFTGINMPYERPISADITIKTEKISIDDSANLIVDYLYQKQQIIL